MIKKHFLLLFVIGFFQFNTQGQVIKEWGIGPELVLNIPLVEPAIGARAHLHLSNQFFLSPSVFYFPGFNNINELYAGLGVNFKILQSQKWSPYFNASGFYNRFINYAASPLPDAQPNNFVFEAGIGAVKNYGCWRPFVEYRVNTKWWESNLTAGVLVYFNACKGGGKGKGGRNDCPAFTLLN